MHTYRVMGTKYQNYYTIVSATDEYQAAEIANARPLIDWDEIPTDDVVEATDVYLDEDTDIDLTINI
jgi:hypothetical protein